MPATMDCSSGEGFRQMKILHGCECTKDAMLLCSRDNTFIPIHKLVGGHGSPYLRRKFYNLSSGVANGSSEVYSGVSVVTVSGGIEAGKVAVSVMYEGLKVIPIEWFNEFVGKLRGLEKLSRIRKWVVFIREVVVVAKELEMHHLLQLALISNFNVMLHDEENSATLLCELVSGSRAEVERCDELLLLAKHTYWFLKATKGDDAIFVYSTDVRSTMNNGPIFNLDSSKFGPPPDLDCRETPTVLLLGSSLTCLNGLYKMDCDCSESSFDFLYLKEGVDGRVNLFWEGCLRSSINNEKIGHRFLLQIVNKLKRKRKGCPDSISEGTTEASGVWENFHVNPSWDDRSLGHVFPVPFRYHLKVQEEKS